MNLKILTDYGIDWERGVARCMGDADFYISMLKMFLEDDALIRAKTADGKELFEYLHKLKGVCGNLEMGELFSALCPLVELLRSENPNGDEVSLLMDRAEREHTRVSDGIKALLADG